MGIQILDRCRCRIYDFVHHVDTYRNMSIDLQVVGTNKQFGMAYRMTLPKSMRTILKHLHRFDPATAFMDIGRGKSCTLLVSPAISLSEKLSAWSLPTSYAGSLRTMSVVTSARRHARTFQSCGWA
jgi:hypothetical protein